jgi:hypothetical protein
MISITDGRISCSSCWTGFCHRRERAKERKKEKAGHGLLLLSSSSSSRREGAKRMTFMSSLKNRLKITKKYLFFEF